ncbi:hypothetical protein CD30_08995 [Ureibacillus massiliensis 4400831 = CIP 108448 = CCUG 49529]|uniref:Uncharacterized protein n=1 Tax=Ureibacillus massiliensis 4400831 = CIP 108448 = CCUG 49529 TaxID=1211035 RepID=A0A0A3J6S5_9BACL|nr:hypothetical protein [Ureibacillus massiliensis]KGR90843.1 hypothetical protein CD30_08995 [Ureibacillus massiliensis 4400831 = CIP 108448 = CCUG 49529]
MGKSDLNFKDSKFFKSNPKDHKIKIKYNENKQYLKVEVPLENLKEENLTLSEDGKYYLLYIKPTLTLPDKPDIQFEF